MDMRPSGRNEGSMVVVVNESYKSSLCDDGEECEDQVEDHLVANEKTIEIPAENDGRVERFSKDERCPKRKRHLPGEWWKNHILPQRNEKQVNMTLLDDPLNLCKTL